MINNYKKITIKYLRANRKRTLLTIIGIVLSVALISSIGLFFKGIEKSEIDSIKSNYGSYHLIFSKTNDALVSKITNNPRVSRSGLFKTGEKIKIGDKLFTNKITATDRALELLPFRVKIGRLPQNKNEIVMEKWILRYIDKNAKVGGKIKLNKISYTLVGILEDNIGSQVGKEGIILSIDNNIDKEKASLIVEISSKTNLRNAVKELSQLGEKNTVYKNDNLITVQGGGENGSAMENLYMVIGVIIGIVLIATIAVIFNSFQISVVERIKQFGLLRAIGTTPKQIRKIVLGEATIMAVVGVPIGLLFGVIAIYGIGLAFKIIGGNTVNFMKPSISPMVMEISALVGIVAIYISALIPAFFAGKISPLLAISSRTSITKEKIKRRKTTIAGKIFGFEGTMAAKNIKRNRKRYRITVFSIIISVVLFITFKSFMDMSFTVSTELNESNKENFTIQQDYRDSAEKLKIDDKMIGNLQALKSVKKLYKEYDNYNFSGAMNKKSEVKEIQGIGNIYKSIKVDGINKTLIDSSIAIYDRNSLEAAKSYIEKGSISIENLNKENGVILINKNIIYNYKTNKNYYGPVANIRVGDEIEIQNDMTKQSKKNLKVKVLAILKSDPFDFDGNQNGLKLITTEEMGKKLIGKEALNPRKLNIVIKDIKNEEKSFNEIENVIQSDYSLTLINRMDSNRNQKSAKLMINILMYGFVVVISLISSVNIINTLTTNIILRRREFATLKAIGLTQRGLSKLIVLEGLLYGIVGAIYGSIIGCGISYVLFKGLSGVREFGWSIPWNAIGIASFCSLILGYLSILSPLARIKKDNLIEIIREEC